MKFYPIFFYPRSGSTVVDSILNQHPKLMAINEPFLGHGTVHLDHAKEMSELTFKSFMEPIVATLPNKRDKKNVCFQYNTYQLKLFLRPVSDQAHLFFIQQNFDKLIVIRRKNLLKQLVSYFTAESTGKWHTHVDESVKHKKISLPLEISPMVLQLLLPGNYTTSMKLIEFLSVHEHYINNTLFHLYNSNLKWLDIVYEDHIEKLPLVAVEMIENFLGLDKYDQYKVLFKKHSNLLKDSLDNFNDVKIHLENSQYSWMSDQ